MSTAVGDAFEARVADLFRDAGYSVEQKKQQDGFQFDLVVTDQRGYLVPTRIVVECKYSASKNVTEDQIRSFRNAFVASAFKIGASSAVVVTTIGYARGTSEIVSDYPGIKLLTLEELENELMGSYAYINSYATQYAFTASKIVLPLPAQKVVGSSGSVQRYKDVASIADYIQTEISARDRSAYFILGDFGTGKTTVAEKIHASVGKAFMEDKADIFPFLFKLGTLSAYDSAEKFVSAQISQISPTSSSRLFSAVGKSNRTLVILDGFDEIATNASRGERSMYFMRMFKIAMQADYLVITSRPGIFSNLGEIEQLLANLVESELAETHTLPALTRRVDQSKIDLIETPLKGRKDQSIKKLAGLFPSGSTELLYLREISDDAIVAYLEAWSNELRRAQKKSPREVMAALKKIYDLSGIVTRPLLLEMLVDLLVKRQIVLDNPGMELGPVKIYSIYVNYHLDRDWKSRPFNSRAHRLAFARAAALAMLESGGALEASDETIQNIMHRGGELFSYNIAEDLDERDPWDDAGSVTDFRVCAFLNITSQNKIVFTHKSFMEYFVADIIMLQLKHGRAIEQLRLPLNYEILFFLGGFAYIRSTVKLDLLNHLRNVGYNQSARYRQNIQIAIMFSEVDCSERKFDDMDVPVLKVVKKAFSSCTFRNVSVDRASIDKVAFSDCAFHDLSFDGEAADVEMTRCHGLIRLPKSCFGINLNACQSIDIGRVKSVERFDISRSVITFDANAFSVRRGEWRGAVLHLPHATSVEISEINLTGCELRRAPVKAEKDSSGRLGDTIKLRIGNCRVRDGLLFGFRISKSNYMELGSGLNLDGFRGYIFVEQTQSLESFKRVVRPAYEDNILADAPDAEITTYLSWVMRGEMLCISSDLEAKVRQHLEKLEAILRKNDAEERDDWIRRYL